MIPTTIRAMIRPLAILLLAAGPLLQGLAGFADPNAYVFAPLAAVALLPLTGSRKVGASLRLAVLFLVIGAAAMGLWWLGRQAAPALALLLPSWVPLAVAVAGAALSLFARPRP